MISTFNWRPFPFTYGILPPSISFIILPLLYAWHGDGVSPLFNFYLPFLLPLNGVPLPMFTKRETIFNAGSVVSGLLLASGRLVWLVTMLCRFHFPFAPKDKATVPRPILLAIDVFGILERTSKSS
jgi:hypothetical protein